MQRMAPERSFEAYDDLLQAIYTAGLSPDVWPETVARLADACSAPRAMLFTLAHTVDEGGFCIAHNIPQKALESWAGTDEKDRADPFARRIAERALMIDGACLIGDDLVGRSELVQTRFYKEWWEPFDIGQLCVGIVFGSTDAYKLPTAFSLYRSVADPPFGADEVSLLSRLLPHLSRALGTMFHLRDSSRRVATTSAALDRLRAAVIVLDANKAVRFANEAATRLLETRTALKLQSTIEPGRRLLGLHPSLWDREAEFQALLARAVASPRIEYKHNDHFSDALLLHGNDGRPAVVLHIAPLPARAHPTPIRSVAFEDLNGDAKAIVFAYDLSDASKVQPPLLRDLFGLTAAEARAALALLGGGTIEEIAQRLTISLGTLKTQLAHVYAKTGTTRQIDLLKLLFSLTG